MRNQRGAFSSERFIETRRREQVKFVKADHTGKQAVLC
jgi:hypothetical protein